jgi:hypothetical protein
MIARCCRPTQTEYYRYGGRGITVCDRWRTSFENFLADMGVRPDGMTLEREDNEGNYEPGNCKWETPHLQLRNTRRNNVIEFNGETKVLTDWAADIGITGPTLYWRINHWGVERALTTPKRTTHV